MPRNTKFDPSIDPYQELNRTKESSKSCPKRYDSVSHDRKNVTKEMDASCCASGLVSILFNGPLVNTLLSSLRLKGPLAWRVLSSTSASSSRYLLKLTTRSYGHERLLVKVCRACGELCGDNITNEKMVEHYGLPDFQLDLHEDIYNWLIGSVKEMKRFKGT